MGVKYSAIESEFSETPDDVKVVIRNYYRMVAEIQDLVLGLSDIVELPSFAVEIPSVAVLFLGLTDLSGIAMILFWYLGIFFNWRCSFLIF
jgi:hypothetical protein